MHVHVVKAMGHDSSGRQRKADYTTNTERDEVKSNGLMCLPLPPEEGASAWSNCSILVSIPSI